MMLVCPIEKKKNRCACRLVANTVKIEISKVKFLILKTMESSLLMITTF